MKNIIRKLILHNRSPKIIRKLALSVHHRRLGQTPSYSIENSTVCNLKCRFCTHPKINLEKEFITSSIFNRIIAEINRFHNRRFPNKELTIVYGGLGEPLLHPLYLEHLRQIRRDFPNARIQVDTNGVVLDSETSKVLVSEHLVDMLSISLNAPNRKLYEKLMVQDKFDTVIHNIYDFIEIRNDAKSEIKLSICVKDTDDNRQENFLIEEQLTSILSESDQFWINDILNWGGMINVQDLNSNSHLKHIDFPCYGILMVSNIVIDIYGNVYPCCTALGTARGNSYLLLGNVCEKHLTEIWEHGRHLEIKRIMMEGGISTIKPCKLCTAYSDRAYDLFFHNPFPFGPKFL